MTPKPFSLCLLPFAMVLVVAGCKSPFDRTRDASKGGGTGTITATTNFVVFSSELVTGGGAFEYPGSQGQSLVFNDSSNPISRRSIRYSWTGELVTNLGCPAQNPANLAGFDLQHAVNQSDYATAGRDLRATGAGYTKVTFYARGSLSTYTVLKIEAASAGAVANACVPPDSPCMTLSAKGNAADDSCSSPGYAANPYAKPPEPLTATWQQYSIPIPNSQLANVRDFLKATFVYTPAAYGAPTGQGGTVYFDQIQYEQ